MTHIFTGYEATVAYLMERLPLFSRIGKAALKPNLDNTIALCAALNNPHHRFKSIHIAGTNGKGSTAHALAAILQKAGYKTGLYTSPHLADFRERIRIDGQFIDKDWVVNFVNLIQPTIENNNPSFFEITVVMAFQAFADANVDIAVIETGLGGRLDSTNVITPLLSIITNISYDHTDLLGTTLAQIAGEKAGIIKPNIPVIIGERHVETEPVFASKALACLSPITFTQDIWQVEADKEGREEVGHIHYIARKKGIDTHHNIATDLQGNYQQHNLKTILTAAEMLPDIGYNRVDSGVIVDALRQVNALTGLQGRWQLLHTEPTIIADVAHNVAGIGYVVGQWQGVKARKKYILLGMVRDKEIDTVLSLLPQNNYYLFTNAQIPRALPVNELIALSEKYHLQGHSFPTVTAAVEHALTVLNKQDALLITGSFFIVGEAVEYFAGRA